MKTDKLCIDCFRKEVNKNGRNKTGKRKERT